MVGDFLCTAGIGCGGFRVTHFCMQELLDVLNFFKINVVYCFFSVPTTLLLHTITLYNMI